MLFGCGSERGKVALEIVGWAAAASLVLVVAGYVVIAKPGQAKTPKLTPEQQAYVQAVATQQALAYISAIATQQADAYIIAVATQQASAAAEAPPPTTLQYAPSPRAQVASAPPPTTAPPKQSAPAPQAPIAHPTLTTAPSPVQPAPVQSLTRYDLVNYAYSIGCNGSECTCVADTLLQHFTLDQISRQGIAASAAMIAADVSKCFDPRYKPDPLPTAPLPTPDPSCVPC
jgi:hypothetical protein